MPSRAILLIGALMIIGTDVLAESDSTGASSAWTSPDPLVRQARALVAEGQLASADKLLAPMSSELPARQEMREIIRRLRHEYALDESALLTKLRPTLPDVGQSDLLRWREAGQLQFRILDGQVRYFRREPSNLFRFCAEVADRKPPAQPSFALDKHLAQIIAAAQTSNAPEVLPIRHRIRYGITIPPSSLTGKPNALARCWLPYPAEHPRQRNIHLLSASSSSPLIAPPDAPHRTIYLEQRITDLTRPVRFDVEFEFTSLAYYPRLDESLARPLSSTDARGFLDQRPPHIIFTPELRKIVRDLVGAERNPLIIARRIFQFIDTEIRYCAEEEYCLIPSFTEKALRTRRGDCGIQSTLFIAMCRCAGVPARWQSGWQTKPGDWNMHDWAEFYVEPWGWLPADPSYGLRDSDDPAIRWFYLGHQDSYRLIVNSDYGRQLTPPKQSMRSEPADFQRGEVEVDGQNLYFDQWDWQIEFDWPTP